MAYPASLHCGVLCLLLNKVVGYKSATQLLLKNILLPVTKLSSAMFDFTRFFDMIISFLALLILSPFLLIISIIIKLNSKGNIIFSQKRVGRHGKDFTMYKFRTMHTGAEMKRHLTVGNNDSRITKVGVFLRKYKLDELPQLWNVLKNDMSIVGPRPELRKFVDMYDADQLQVLGIKPGITDLASVEFSDENDLLAAAADPEKYYTDTVMPAKILLSMDYVHQKTTGKYFNAIFRTIHSVFGKRKKQLPNLPFSSQAGNQN